MGAPVPPTEGERAARAAFVETKNDVALLIEVSNRGLLSGPEEEPQGFEQMLLDLSKTAPKLAAASRRLRHNLPERADTALPEVERHTLIRAVEYIYFLVWPDGEVIGDGRYTNEAPSKAIRDLKIARKRWPEARLYNASDETFIDPEEEP